MDSCLLSRTKANQKTVVKKLLISGLGLSLLAAGIWFFFGIGYGLSGSDLLAIRQVMREKTAEPIIDISGEGTGSAKVRTGRRGTGLDGIGHEYYLNRTERGWQIVSRSVWMSMR